jgi:hypothetical protein
LLTQAQRLTFTTHLIKKNMSNGFVRYFKPTAPNSSGYVPYVGATQDVNLGNFGLDTDFLAFNLTPTATANAVGKMVWNNTEGTLEFRLRGNNVTLQVGQERVAYCNNVDATTITDGQAVYVFGATGARPSVKKSSNTSINSQRTIGIATETFSVGANGFVTSYGIVHGLDTTAFAEGDFLYVGVNGNLINTTPTQPAYSVFIGVCIKVDDTDGHIDDITRFVNADTVVTVVEENKADGNYEILQENLHLLKQMRLEDGKQLNVVELPMPSPVIWEEQRLPASYANFYIANEVVVVPTFRDKNDRRALDILSGCFPTRRVVGIDSTDIIWGLGSFHCLSQQEPAV